jgi:8-oxo-dGTP pyrophosphatase MutT (NUDIX family)
VRRWRRVESRRVQRCGIFDLDRVRFEPPDAADPRWYWVLDVPDWINVIALTDDDHVVLVRQHRFGIDEVTLEIPGGMCDPGEPPADAARRELLEETGFAAGSWTELGWVHPNPPIQNNRCTTFLAREIVRRAAPRPDPDERIETVLVPLDDVPRLVADRHITHALVIAAFQWLRREPPAVT